MTNETKLWQLRAGLITESEYQDSMEEIEQEELDPNIENLLRALRQKLPSVKLIDTVPEFIKLIDAVVDLIQQSNDSLLSNQEIGLSLRKLVQQHSQATKQLPNKFNSPGAFKKGA